MSNSNNYSNNTGSNSSSNRLNVPQARQAMDQFKMQAANEVGVNLKNGYNGDLTSREAGDLGKAQMVLYEMRDSIETTVLHRDIHRR